MDYIDIAQCFGIVRRRAQSLIVEACSDLDLTYSEFVLLLKLYDNENCSQDDMANFLFLDKAVVTRVIKYLEEKGLIYRETDNEDRRLKRLFLTSEGKEIEDYIKGIITQLISYMARGMDPEKVNIMVAGFIELSEKLSKADFEEIYGYREGLTFAK